MKVILFVVNDPRFLVSHRLEICKAVVEEGYQVHVASPFEIDSVNLIKDLGIVYHQVEFSRNGTNPFEELKSMLILFGLYKRIEPDIVHLVTLKPYLYGGVAARLANVPCIVSAVAGLGILFSSNLFKYRILRLGLYPLFKFAFGHKNQSVIFQNLDDRDALVNWNIVSTDKVRMIRGSGVDLTSCPVLPEPNDIPIVSFAARLLKDKGVEVFVEASRLFKLSGVKVRFWLIGEPDKGNANSVTLEQLKQWESEGLVELFGFRKDICDLFSQSNIVSLPSFYGEGVPKVLIEAAACGRAVVTTNHPGCRDAIEPDVSGVLVPVRDAKALAIAIQGLIDNPAKRKAMGLSGRKLAEDVFDVHKVVDEHLNIYSDLVNQSENRS